MGRVWAYGQYLGTRCAFRAMSGDAPAVASEEGITHNLLNVNLRLNFGMVERASQTPYLGCRADGHPVRQTGDGEALYPTEP